MGHAGRRERGGQVHKTGRLQLKGGRRLALQKGRQGAAQGRKASGTVEILARRAVVLPKNSCKMTLLLCLDATMRSAPADSANWLMASPTADRLSSSQRMMSTCSMTRHCSKMLYCIPVCPATLFIKGPIYSLPNRGAPHPGILDTCPLTYGQQLVFQKGCCASHLQKTGMNMGCVLDGATEPALPS